MPNEKIHQDAGAREKKHTGHVLRGNYVYVVAMFLLMTIFFIYPSNFAMETAADGVIPQQLIAVIMAMMDFVAFIGGWTFVKVRRICKENTKYLAPVLFLVGYLLMVLLAFIFCLWSSKLRHDG